MVTTPIVMSLFDKKVIDLETKLKNIIPRYKDSNKSDISIKELLSGHAGLQAWIPFYKMTLDEEINHHLNITVLKEIKLIV